ncbi:heat stress transcription factor B-4-like protein [Tanacetum coccineum]
MYVDGHVDIFDMVDIDLFIVVALNMMVVQLGYIGKSEPLFYNYLRPLTSLDEGLYALACKEDVSYLATLIRSFKLIEVYIEHGVKTVDSYNRPPPRVRATIEDITDEPGSIATIQHRSEKCFRYERCDEATEAGFGDVAEPIVEEVRIQDPIMKEVRTQEPIMEDVIVVDYVSSGEDVEQGNGQEDESALNDGHFFNDVKGIDNEENEIVKLDVDVHLFGISIDVLFDNIGVTNLVPDDILEGEDVDVINADGFDSDPGNENETGNYRRRRQKFTTAKEAKDRVYLHSIDSRRNLKLYKNDSVRVRARCDEKVLVFTMSQAGPSGSSGPTTRSKKRKNTGTNDDSQASSSVLDAHDKGDLCPWVLEIKHCTYKFLSEKIFEQVRVNPDIPVKAVQDQLQRELEVQISMSKAFRAKAKAEREIRGDHVLQYSMLRDYVVELQSTNPNTTVKIAVERNTDPSLPTRVFQRIYICLGALKLGFRACRRDLLGLDGAFMKGPFPGQVLVAVGLDSNNGIYPLAYALVEAESKSSWCWFLQCLGDDIDLHPNSNFTFISDRQKGIIPAIKTIYPSAEHRYCLRHIHENMKQGWCGQAYKDLLWRAASATNVRDFEKCMLELKTMNPKAHEWLNKIPAEHWARSYFSVRGRDKPVITLLEYIREYCMKRIVNVQGVIDKCTGPLTPTATRIMESIKKEAHLMKVQWNGANKYQVSGSLGDQCVVDVVGRPKKKRKRSKHEDEPFVKDGKLSRKGRTITCQSCGNIGHNKATCKGQGRKAKTGGNNAEGSGSASRQAQQTEPAIGQDGSRGSGVGAIKGLSAAGEGGAGDPGGAGVASQVSQARNADGKEMGDGVPTQSSAAGGASEWSFL